MSTPVKSTKIRQDLAVKYTHKRAPAEDASSGEGIVAQSMPLVAMFLRNKFLAWFSLLSAVFVALTKPSSSSKKNEAALVGSSTKLFMCLVSVCICYIDLVFPNEVAFAKPLEQVV